MKPKRYEDMDKFELVNEYGDLIDCWHENQDKGEEFLDATTSMIERLKTLIIQRMN